MQNLDQKPAIGRQKARPASSIRHPASRKRGFTLVEVLMATVISVAVFSAMGVLLVKTLRLWGEGAGQFHLASQARSARARILSGGMGPGTGLLSLSEIEQLQINPQWCTMRYKTPGYDEKFWIQGSVNDDAPANKSVFIKSSKGGGQSWLMMVGVKRGSHNIPDVLTSSFDIAQTGRVLRVSYNLRMDFGGRTYEHPQVLQAYLINQ